MKNFEIQVAPNDGRVTEVMEEPEVEATPLADESVPRAAAVEERAPEQEMGEVAVALAGMQGTTEPRANQSAENTETESAGAKALPWHRRKSRCAGAPCSAGSGDAAESGSNAASPTGMSGAGGIGIQFATGQEQ